MSRPLEFRFVGVNQAAFGMGPNRFHGSQEPKRFANEIPTGPVSNGTATLRLYDPIDSWGGYWGVSAKEFVAALDALPPDVHTIELHINSPGGEVFEGIAILNALRAHKAKFVAVVDGIAASAASFIACGADELVMGRNSEMMIHDALGICLGNAADMQQMADLLAHLSDNIARVYADKSGGTVDGWREAMLAETWMSAEEAVTAGLADRVDGSDEQPENTFDLTVFKNAGRAHAPAPTLPQPRADADTDTDDDPNALIQAVDAAIDEAIDLHANGEDDQAWALITAADSTIDDLMELLGIPDADDDTAGRSSARLRHELNARKYGIPA